MTAQSHSPLPLFLLMFLFPLLLHNFAVLIYAALSLIHAVMAEDGPAEGAVELNYTVTGGSKPVHRFLRGEPKSIGIVLVTMGICMMMFEITKISDMTKSSDVYVPFWLGTLFLICGTLYILSERNPTKKIITASFALSIFSTISIISACTAFFDLFSDSHYKLWRHMESNLTTEEKLYMEQYYMSVVTMEQVFLVHSLIGGVLLIIMTFFASAALRSSRTQAVTVMRNLPSTE